MAYVIFDETVIQGELEGLRFDPDSFKLLEDYITNETILINERDAFAKYNIRARQLLPYYGFRYENIPNDPFELHLQKRFGFLPPIFSIGNIVTLNAQARDILESIEPNVHQYIPIKIVNKAGGPEFEPYWMLNVCTRVVATNIEKSNLKITERIDCTNLPDGKYTMFFGKKIPMSITPKQDYMVLKLNKDVVQGRTFWFEWKLSHLFISDAFVEALKIAGINPGYVHNKFHAEEL